AADEKRDELRAELDPEVQELTAQVEADIARRAEEARARIAEIESQTAAVREQLEAYVNEAAPEELRLDALDWVVVQRDAMVRPDHLRELEDRVREERDRIETDARLEEQRDRQRIVDLTAAKNETIAEQIAQIDGKLASEMDSIRAAADARIARIDGVRELQTLTENEYRDLVDACGRIFKANMGAEAIRERLKAINLDELASELRTETRSSSGQRRK